MGILGSFNSKVVINNNQVRHFHLRPRRLLPGNYCDREIFVWVISGLAVAAPEWRCSISSLKVGMEAGYCHVNYFGCHVVGPGSVIPVFCSGDSVHLLRSVQRSISQWIALFSNMSHRLHNTGQLETSWFFVNSGVVFLSWFLLLFLLK